MINFIMGVLFIVWTLGGIFSLINFAFNVMDNGERIKVKHLLGIIVFVPHYLALLIGSLAMMGVVSVVNLINNGKIGEFLNKEIKKSK